MTLRSTTAVASVSTIAFDALVGAECMKLQAYAGFTLLNILTPTGQRKALRQHLAVAAHNTGVIAKNTWESYAKGVELAADLFLANAREELADIYDMNPQEAVDAVRGLYEGLNVMSGSDIREWAKAGVFAPLDKAAIAAERSAKNKADKLAKGQSAAALFFAQAPGIFAGETVAPSSAPAPVSALATILAAIGTLGHADAAEVLAALNAHMVGLDATVASLPAPSVAPVLADDVVPHPLSALGKVSKARKAA